MRQEVKVLLADALLSGDYLQTKKYLNRGGCMCVMGVLCDLYAKEYGINNPWVPFCVTVDHNEQRYGFGDACLLRGPSKEVMEWAGIATRNGHLTGRAMELIRANDTGISFARLAEMVMNIPSKVA